MRKTVSLNQNTGLLKLLAITSMLIDHLGARIYPGVPEMRIIGRLAFPLFAYCIAVGAVYTRSMGKYILRLLLIGIIAQPLYALALNHINPIMNNLDFQRFPLQSGLQWYIESLNYSNIMFELALGLLVIWSIQERKYALTGILVAATWYLSPYLTTSYGWRGVALIVMFYALMDSPVHLLVWATGFMAWWGFYSPGSTNLFAPYMTTQAWAMCALPLIFIPLRNNIKLNKWVFYLFYPGHLAVIYALSQLPG